MLLVDELGKRVDAVSAGRRSMVEAQLKSVQRGDRLVRKDPPGDLVRSYVALADSRSDLAGLRRLFRAKAKPQAGSATEQRVEAVRKYKLSKLRHWAMEMMFQADAARVQIELGEPVVGPCEFRRGWVLVVQRARRRPMPSELVCGGPYGCDGSCSDCPAATRGRIARP